MSAKWRPSNKNRKWQNINELTKSERAKKHLETQPIAPQKSLAPTRITAPQKATVNAASKKPKPLIDIFQDNSNITVIAEIAGFNKDTVKIDSQKPEINPLSQIKRPQIL